jgi:predicted ATPase/DNA-binding winged helix-turn-helix (wHTH) protein
MAGERTGLAPAESLRTMPVLAFGPFQLHRSPRMLYHGGDHVRLGGRAIDLLVALVERAGEVVSRAELERQVWPYSVVEDSSLRVHIAALRRALGDGIGAARYIANIPGRGYSFVAEVGARYPAPRAGEQAGAALEPRQLPTRLNTIVGRDQAVAAIARDLGARRLATIVGHGGMGKTALALAVAHQIQKDYADGACFVDLAPVTDPALLATVLASALGITLFGENILSNLAIWLGPRRMLLVIDNCEHLIDAATALVHHILHAAPGIDVLATSREPLDAEGEWVHRLKPLASPPDGIEIDCAAALAYPAVRLLVDRAMASADGFALTDDNLAPAIALCQRLDGVPLAIEFAAARIGLLGVQGVVAQLDDRLRLLGTGRRTALPRHRTLRALLDWSYDLLAPGDQRILRCCGIFHGTFAFDSAVAILADATMDATEVQVRLLGLVRKSLLVAETDAPEVTLGLLSITRAYALTLLHADPAFDTIAERHAQHMVALMARCEADWEVLPGAVWRNRYGHAMRNVRGALDWAFGPGGNPALGVRLCGAMMLQIARLFSDEELRACARQARDAILAGTPAAPLHRMRIDIILADTTAHGAATGPALPASYAGALEQGEREGNAAAQCEALFQIGTHYFGAGDYRAMRQMTDRLSQLAAEAGLEAAMVVGDRMGAQAAHFLGDHAHAATLAARVFAQPGVVLPVALSSPVDRAVSMRIVQARILWMQGCGGRAAVLAAECLVLAARDVTPISLAHALGLAAIPIALWRGDHVAACGAVDRLAAHAERHAMAYWAGWARHFRRVLALRDGSLSPAAMPPLPMDTLQADHCVTFAPQLHAPATLARTTEGRVLWCAPEVWRVQGERLLAGDGDEDTAAERWFLQGLELARRQGAWSWVLRCACSLARLRCIQGRPEAAVALLAPLLDELPGDTDSLEIRAAREIIDLAH